MFLDLFFAGLQHKTQQWSPTYQLSLGEKFPTNSTASPKKLAYAHAS